VTSLTMSGLYTERSRGGGGGSDDDILNMHVPTEDKSDETGDTRVGKKRDMYKILAWRPGSKKLRNTWAQV